MDLLKVVVVGLCSDDGVYIPGPLLSNTLHNATGISNVAVPGKRVLVVQKLKWIYKHLKFQH